MVITIIAILAALSLPVLSKGFARAKVAACVSHLKQVGIAHNAFAHEHNSLFPAQVGTNQGGALEVLHAAYRQGDLASYAPRHFQTLVDQLSTPRLVVCPADRREPAVDFKSLTGDHLSYFAGTDAQYRRPDSVLAGDANLVAWPPSAGLLRVGPGSRLFWTRERHQFKGNFVFADGHVETFIGAQLTNAFNGATQTVTLLLPVPSLPIGSLGQPGTSFAAAPPPRRPEPGPGPGPAPGTSPGGLQSLQNFFDNRRLQPDPERRPPPAPVQAARPQLHPAPARDAVAQVDAVDPKKLGDVPKPKPPERIEPPLLEPLPPTPADIPEEMKELLAKSEPGQLYLLWGIIGLLLAMVALLQLQRRRRRALPDSET